MMSTEQFCGKGKGGGKMKNLEQAIRILENQVVRLDLTTRWQNGYKITRSLIGKVLNLDDIGVFSVNESFDGGKIIVNASYGSVESIRFESDIADFAAVILIDTTKAEEND
jgi:hypothetical protein